MQLEFDSKSRQLIIENCYVPGLYILFFSNGTRNGIINFCSVFFRREGARQGCGAYEQNR